MRSDSAAVACCHRCGGAVDDGRLSRRQFYMSAVFPRTGQVAPAARRAPLPAVVEGTVLGLLYQSLILGCGNSHRRIGLAADAALWRGGPVAADGLRAGDHAVVLLHPQLPDLAVKVWAAIGRATGTVTEKQGGSLLVSPGTSGPPQEVVIPARAADRIRVRFPVLDIGSLIDVIGVRSGSVLEALVPATAQPSYVASRVARMAEGPDRAPGVTTGSATWHEPEPGEPPEGVAYPAVDCAATRTEDVPAGATLPYLAVGSTVLVRNDCTGAAAKLGVTACGPLACQFHDRCLSCGASARGRIADLTLASFARLGGELERGCFNATIMMEVRQ